VGRELRGAVVVITGASSGIGRAAALAFAREGSRLVLEHAVQHLADEAVAGYGRIDVWVNGAGVIAYGCFEDIPSDVFRAVIETNLLGQVNGARAALRCFRRQDDGTLIKV